MSCEFWTDCIYERSCRWKFNLIWLFNSTTMSGKHPIIVWRERDVTWSHIWIIRCAAKEVWTRWSSRWPLWKIAVVNSKRLYVIFLIIRDYIHSFQFDNGYHARGQQLLREYDEKKINNAKYCSNFVFFCVIISRKVYTKTDIWFLNHICKPMDLSTVMI